MAGRGTAMFEAFYTIVSRDLLLALRRRSDIFSTLFFFVIVVSLFPLGIGPEMATLRLIAPGVFWVAALLASMLALERLFAADFYDGTPGADVADTSAAVSAGVGENYRPLAGHGSAAGADGAVAGPAVRSG